MKVLIPSNKMTREKQVLLAEGYDVAFNESPDSPNLAFVIKHIDACDAVVLPRATVGLSISVAACICCQTGKQTLTVIGNEIHNTKVTDVTSDIEFGETRPRKPNHRSLPKILIVGPGRCGKDSLGDFIHNNSKHTYAGSTSKFLVKYVAEYFRIPPEQAYPFRHKHRERWFEIGNAIRENDHGLLQKEALAVGNVVAGIRDFREIAWACYNEIYDHIIWIDADVEQDPTLTFTANDIAVMLSSAPCRSIANREGQALENSNTCGHAVMLKGRKTKFTRIKNNKDNQFFADARKLIEAIG